MTPKQEALKKIQNVAEKAINEVIVKIKKERKPREKKAVPSSKKKSAVKAVDKYNRIVPALKKTVPKVKKVLTQEEKEEAKKKRNLSIIKKNHIPDKSNRALSAVSALSKKLVPISLEKVEAQKKQIKATAVKRLSILTDEEKKLKKEHAKELAKISRAKRLAKMTPEMKENEKLRQKALRDARKVKK